MTDDRRNDLGMKVMISVFTSTLAIVLGLFTQATWTVANDGRNIGNEVRAELQGVKADVEAKYQYISSDLAEIKYLLKRTVPNK